MTAEPTTTLAEPDPEPVAVVGFAGAFPGAADCETFFENLRAGRNCIDHPSAEELLARGVSEDRVSHRDYVRAVASMPDVGHFDTDLFAMTPREASMQDPQHRVFLHAVHAALENAGYAPFDETAPTGVFGGSLGSGYLINHLLRNPSMARVDPNTLAIYANSSYLPTFTSYKLSLTGPSVAVATACSTSLVALHLAAEALRRGSCGIAVAGASNIEFPYGHGYLWQPGSMESRTGLPRPFDAAADGTVFASGVGVVVLKLLRDALADGDTIRAVIRASAINNDGSDKVSFGAPSVSGQVRAILAAMREANVRPQDIDYVEAHGTGTRMGDPLEIEALTRAYRELGGDDLAPGSIPVGSVKSNIGHLGPAAGVAGLIKTILALEHEEIPPSINVETPNPAIDFASTPLTVNRELRPWPRTPERPRIAAVSSFGVGGTNAHLIVEEPPAPQPAASPEPPRPRLVVWSGRSAEAREATGRRLGDWFDGLRTGAPAPHRTRFEDAVFTLQVGRTHHPVRAAAVCATPEEAAAALRDGGRGALRGRPGRAARRPLCFAFPGQGAQRTRMALGLYQEVARFADIFDECLDHLAEHGVELRDAWRSDDGTALDRTDLAQSALFAVEYALSQTLVDAGLRPEVVFGHSLGELVAATVAGVFDLPDAARVVAARGRLMAEMPGGAMLAASLSAARLAEFADAVAGEVSLAAVNGPRQITVSGSQEVLEDLQQRLTEEGVRCQLLRTSHAFHSPAMAEAAERFEAVLDDVDLRAPTLRVVSAATGRDLTEEEAVSPAFWARQLVEPVQFHAAVQQVLDDADHLVLEVGPCQTLTGLVRQHPAVVRDNSTVVPVSPRVPEPEDDLRALLTAVGTAYTEGYELHWPVQAEGRRVPLPGYAFQSKHHWVDAQTATQAASRAEPQRDARQEPRSAPTAPPTPTTAPPGAPPAEPAGAPQPTAPVTASTPVDEAGDAQAGSAAHRDAAPVAAPVEVHERTTVSPFATLRWYEEPLSPTGPRRSTARVLALLPADAGDARLVLDALHRAGHLVYRVRPGDRLELGEEEFTVRPGNADDLAAVFDQLAVRGTPPQLCVHAWGASTWEEASPENCGRQLDLACLSLFDLIRLGTRRPVDGELPEIVVVSAGAVDVSGAEQPHPVKAMLLGPVLTFREEAPGARCRLVDVDANVDVRLLAEELLHQGTAPVVAWRGSRRWQREECELHLPSGTGPGAARGTALREEGVYLVTGGLGGLGLETAKGLVRAGVRPRLALLGRRVPDGRPALPEPAATRVRKAVAEMTALGAEVRLLACDVTDAEQVDEAVAAVVEEFGRVDGVVHAAGVAGDGVIQLRAHQDVLRVVRPKVLGTLLLERALRQRECSPDFFVSYSSRAGSHGLVGSGDYAAANAFLDASAAGSRGRTRTLSIGWPSWRHVGMAAQEMAAAAPGGAVPFGAPAAAGDTVEGGQVLRDEVMAAGTHWVLAEHLVNGVPVVPGTGQLDLVLRAWQNTVDATAALRLEDVTFLRPLVVDSARRVQVVARPAADAERFSLRSQPAGGGAWTEHTTGVVWLVEPVARKVDLAALEAELAAQEPPAEEPRGAATVELGPRWDVLGRTVRGASADLVELTLPERFVADLSDHALHPALLDNATSMAQRPVSYSRLPFHYEALTVFSPLPQRSFAHVRYRLVDQRAVTVDVDVIAPDGQVCVAVEGFTLRRVDPDNPFGDTTSGGTRRAPKPQRLPGAVDEQTGVEPHQGVNLLLELLDAPTPAHVLVRPHRHGRPMPLDEPTRAGRTGRTTAVTVSAPTAPASAPAQVVPAQSAPASAPAAVAAPTAPAPAPVPVAPAAPPAPAVAEPPTAADASTPADGGQTPARPDDAAGTGTAGDDEVTAAIRRIWAESLGMDNLRDDDDFFELGGNSLTAISLMAEIRELFGVELSVAMLFECPTVELLAEAVRKQREAA